MPTLSSIDSNSAGTFSPVDADVSKNLPREIKNIRNDTLKYKVNALESKSLGKLAALGAQWPNPELASLRAPSMLRNR